MKINFRGNSGRLLLSIFSILAISAIMFSLSACVVATDRGSYYAQEPYSRPGDLCRIQGLWFLSAANVPGKLEFYLAGNAWSGRIWFDAYQQWEALTDIFFDLRTGEIQFTRPGFNQRYIGTLSGNQLVGTFTYEGKNLPGRQDAIKRISINGGRGRNFPPPASLIHPSFLLSQVLLPNATSNTFQRSSQDLVPLSSIPLCF
jgi:hypothetical protein